MREECTKKLKENISCISDKSSHCLMLTAGKQSEFCRYQRCSYAEPTQKLVFWAGQDVTGYLCAISRC